MRSIRVDNHIDPDANVKAGENAFATKIKILGLKAFAPDDALFRWPTMDHFLAFNRCHVRP